MLAVIIALVLLAACVVAVYLLLKSMGEDGIEAAAPGSCRSGRCGVQPKQEPEPSAAEDVPRIQTNIVQLENFRRKDTGSDNQS